MPSKPARPDSGGGPKNSAASKVAGPDTKGVVTPGPDGAGSESKTNEAKAETKDQ